MGRSLKLLFIIVVTASTCVAQQKKRVAVMDFDYGTVRNYVASIFGGDQDVGRGIADLLVTKLVQDGNYSVIERKALDKILAEQNFSNSDRADASTAAKIGRVLGVDGIIVGSITQFGRDDKSTTVGGGALGGITGRFGVGGVQRRNSKAVVGISARLIDTETAEILAVATGKGESRRAGASLLGAGGSSGGAGGGAVDMSSSQFAETILGEAVSQAVDSVGTQLGHSASTLPTRKINVDGLVADATGNSLVLNVGTKAGVKAGDRLEVRRKIRTIKDPATGKVIRTIEDKIGEVVITEADEASCVGTYTGSSPAKVGDAVKTADK